MIVKAEDYLPPEMITKAKDGGHIDPKHPAVRRFIRAVNKENRGGLTVKEYEKEQKRKKEESDIENAIRIEENYNGWYNRLVWDTYHTVDWEVECNCRYNDIESGGWNNVCDGKMARKVLSPFPKHYAFLECNKCGRHQRWLPFPKEDAK